MHRVCFPDSNVEEHHACSKSRFNRIAGHVVAGNCSTETGAARPAYAPAANPRTSAN
jgi:hypothetical protein